mmetsp:Transcript_41926/g.136006  ORF Transcript_41926/g.136006 Transcript_41926/m.136006 type:complete len:229 (-) Transcript_41926:397-1083(-)
MRARRGRPSSGSSTSSPAGKHASASGSVCHSYVGMKAPRGEAAGTAGGGGATPALHACVSAGVAGAASAAKALSSWRRYASSATTKAACRSSDRTVFRCRASPEALSCSCRSCASASRSRISASASRTIASSSRGEEAIDPRAACGPAERSGLRAVASRSVRSVARLPGQSMGVGGESAAASRRVRRGGARERRQLQPIFRLLHLVEVRQDPTHRRALQRRLTQLAGE